MARFLLATHEKMTEQLRPCWICGDPADSAEHRIKKADLVRAYGRGPYQGDAAPVHFRDGVATNLQGPGSLRVKYRPSLCQRCNTTATQPYDRAYDRFITWVIENETDILRKRLIDFRNVYGSDFEVGQLNLFKYFVKSFGCRLVDAGAQVPQDLIELFDQKQFKTKIRITFCVNEDTHLLSLGANFIGKGNLQAFQSREAKPTDDHRYEWSEHVSWLTVWYWYGRNSDLGLGAKWIADSRFIYLGSSSPLSPENRAELISKTLEENPNGHHASKP
jgi:hypothetical protein